MDDDFSLDNRRWLAHFEKMPDYENIFDINALTAEITFADTELDNLTALAEYSEDDSVQTITKLAAISTSLSINQNLTHCVFFCFIVQLFCNIITFHKEDFYMDNNIERRHSVKKITERLGVISDNVMKWTDNKNMPAANIRRLRNLKISESENWIKSGTAADKYVLEFCV